MDSNRQPAVVAPSNEPREPAHGDAGAAPRAPKYVVIEGPIGVGKSTLTRILSTRYAARTVFEVVEENPFLPLFYTDREKYAFQTQIFFLLSRFKQQQSLFQQELFSQVTVSDYLFAKDRIFATLTLSPAELALYDRIFEELSVRVMKPDLVIYLRADLPVLLARIKKRGREFEAGFDAGYLTDLCEAYNEYFGRYDETPLLVADTSDVNFPGDAREVDHLLEIVAGHRRGTLHYAPRERPDAT